ncbi:MAG: SDR family NAD(P)-dependent oxidoreductase [Moraxellaceae bacterium]|nr:SDR family NAD(P)-dependent oxidoreductase [Moraxellaceae bacterium]
MTTLPLRREVIINRCFDDVLRYLTDFSTIEQWDPGVMEAVKLTPGPVKTGTQFDLILDVLGKPVPMRYGMTAIDVQDTYAKLVLDGQGDGFSAHDELTLHKVSDQQTRVEYAADLVFADTSAWIMPLLKAWGARLANKTVAGLVSALENDGIVHPSVIERMSERLVLPGMINYTRRGYRRMPSKGLSRYMDGRTVGITGITSGLGLATAQQLARLGADLVVVGRNRERLAQAVQQIHDFAGRQVNITCLEAELSSVADTKRLAEVLKLEHRNIDVWINNAGALFNEHVLTDEGHECSLAVNAISPAILSYRLAPQLAERGGRIINMVSGGLYSQGIRLEDFNFTQEPYNGPKAYARAKRILLDLSRYWAKKTPDVRWHIVHPGWANTPGVEKTLPSFHEKLGSRLRNNRMGSDTAVWLASHPDLSDQSLSGKFWFDRAPRPIALLPGTRSMKAEVECLDAWFKTIDEA